VGNVVRVTRARYGCVQRLYPYLESSYLRFLVGWAKQLSYRRHSSPYIPVGRGLAPAVLSSHGTSKTIHYYLLSIIFYLLSRPHPAAAASYLPQEHILPPSEEGGGISGDEGVGNDGRRDTPGYRVCGKAVR
jgi:hypothetical protein